MAKYLIIFIILLGLVIGGFPVANALTCPKPSLFKKQMNKYKVPKGWCWAPNKASTTICKKHIYATKLSFSAAFWSKTLQSKSLAKTALCFYNDLKDYVLYSPDIKVQLAPSGGKWEYKPLFGYQCIAANVNMCPFP